MRNHFILLSFLASLTASSGCQQIECAEGTVERDGRCEPPTGSFDPAKCGPFTELVGDRCVPVFPPTVCEDGSTVPEIDPETGVTTCKGTGTGGGCGTPIACPTPTLASKQTICGQIYDFETNAAFADTGATGAQCPSTPTASGPCSLTITPYDAIGFANNPTTAQPQAHGDVYIDDCGRYRLTDIETNGTSGFIGLGIDDGTVGPGGSTVTVAVATPVKPKTATKELEHFIVKASTTTKWADSGGPPLSGGIYAPVFRAHKSASGAAVFEGQSGVTVIKGSPAMAYPAIDFYFGPTETTRTTVTTASATGVNGTALISSASVNTDGVTWQGQGGLGPDCRWEPHAGATIPGVVFIQIFKKLDILPGTCND